jgi:CHASE2 domain-containing sensor protein
VLIYFAQWVHLLNLIGIDTALERQFLTLSSHTVDRAAIDKLRVIYIDQKNNGPLGAFDDPVSRQAWRAQHAKLLLALEEAGAKVVAFDITFAPSVSDAVAGTQEFARAIADVRERGRTRVIVGYGSDPDIDRDILAAMPCEQMGFVQVARQPQDADG